MNVVVVVRPSEPRDSPELVDAVVGAAPREARRPHDLTLLFAQLRKVARVDLVTHCSYEEAAAAHGLFGW